MLASLALFAVSSLDQPRREAASAMSVRERTPADGSRPAPGYAPPELSGLFDLLERPTRTRPDTTALIVGEPRTNVTYAQLTQLVTDLRAELASRGLRAGDRVALHATNGLEFVVGLLAAAQARLVVVTLNPAVSTAERELRMRETHSRVLLNDPNSSPLPTPHRRHPHWTIEIDTKVNSRFSVTIDDTNGPPLAAIAGGGPLPDSDPDDALIMFTSGTTDRPKRVPLTNANLAASIRGICATYQFGPDDSTVAVMPFFHGHGLLAGLLAALATGGKVLTPAAGRFTAHTFWDDVQAAEANWITAVPTIYRILLHRAASDYPGSRHCPLRFLRSCSAPMDATTAHRLRETFHAPILGAYGMTETTHQAAAQPLPTGGPDKPESVGKPTGTQIRIVGHDGVDVPIGQPGEIRVKGPTVTRGYLENREETARSFIDGWFRTGDLGMIDSDGDLTLTGRIKELINRGGEKISPAQVEAVLGAYPGVTEAAVFAVPDPKYGERAEAAVVAQPGVTAADLLDYCRQKLAEFEVPASIQIVSELPHTPKGSLDRRALAVRFGG